MKTTSPVSGITILGLLIAFFGAPLVLFLYSQFFPGPLTDGLVVLRELSVFGVTAILLWIVLVGEKSDLASIGLHNKQWGKTLLISLVLVMLSFATALACLAVFKWVGISYGEGSESQRYNSVSLWAMTIVMLRAGIVEEICYRGYIMERLEKITGSWLVYFLLPAVVFGLLHYRQGVGGIIIAFSMGMVISYVYWKKRDLKANIIAHFLVDFIPNVLAPLLSGDA